MERWRESINLSEVRVQSLDWRFDLKVSDIVRRDVLEPIDRPWVMMTRQTIHRVQHAPVEVEMWSDNRLYLLMLFRGEFLRDECRGRRRSVHGGLPKLDEFSKVHVLFVNY